MSANHKTVPAQVWVDVDEGIAEAVRHLNTIAGVRTFASCQGTIGAGGVAPYQPYVMAHWPAERKAEIEKHFTIGDTYDTWGYLHPKGPMPKPMVEPKMDLPEFKQFVSGLKDTPPWQ